MEPDLLVKLDQRVIIHNLKATHDSRNEMI